jgi:hypothetical protein
MLDCRRRVHVVRQQVLATDQGHGRASLLLVEAEMGNAWVGWISIGPQVIIEQAIRSQKRIRCDPSHATTEVREPLRDLSPTQCPSDCTEPGDLGMPHPVASMGDTEWGGWPESTPDLPSAGKRRSGDSVTHLPRLCGHPTPNRSAHRQSAATRGWARRPGGPAGPRASSRPNP